MKRLQLSVDALRCEVDDGYLVEELLAQDGVVAAASDLHKDHVSIAFDETRTSKTILLAYLAFFGIRPVVMQDHRIAATASAATKA